MMSSILGCEDSKPAAEPGAAEPGAAEPGAAEPGAAEPGAAEGTRIYDFPQTLTPADLTEAALQADPRAVMFLSEPITDPLQAMQWMAANAEVYSYLPQALQEDAAVQARALELGRMQGATITGSVTARRAPRSDAPVALYPSDTTNGYLSEKRQEQRLSNVILPILDEKTVDGVRWYQLVAASVTTREEDREGFNDVSNVGSISFEDFSFSSDPGWVPASETTPGVITPRCGVGLYTFESVENGDMGVYVSFDGITFDDFDSPNYAILEAATSGMLTGGDQVRLIWCDGSIEWLPSLQSEARTTASP